MGGIWLEDKRKDDTAEAKSTEHENDSVVVAAAAATGRCPNLPKEQAHERCHHRDRRREDSHVFRIGIVECHGEDLAVHVGIQKGRREPKDGIEADHVLHLGIFSKEFDGDRRLSEGASLAVVIIIIIIIGIMIMIISSIRLVVIIDTGHGEGRSDCHHSVDPKDRPPRRETKFQEDRRKHAHQEFFRQVQKGKVSCQLGVCCFDGNPQLRGIVLTSLPKISPLGRPQKAGPDSTNGRPEVGHGRCRLGVLFVVAEKGRYVKASDVETI
mmetsp:Transcript_56182/g.62824  ORF Transcript_56182/g.62824 Transcript_56182/m.62824 type:complete len:269 (+) Transcript_56182:657-1463(+)